MLACDGERGNLYDCNRVNSETPILITLPRFPYHTSFARISIIERIDSRLNLTSNPLGPTQIRYCKDRILKYTLPYASGCKEEGETPTVEVGAANGAIIC